MELVSIKETRVIFLLRHLKKLVTKQYLKTAYYAFFHEFFLGTVLYGITLWANGKNFLKIVIVEEGC